MKKTFSAKSNSLIFFRAIVLVFAIAFFLNSCKKENSSILEQITKVEKEITKTDEKPIVSDEKEELKTSETNKRYIYLTFDDGPNKGTKNLLKVLNKHQVPATSFVIGKHVKGSKSQENDFETLRNNKLIELANHSFSHASNKYSEFYKNPKLVALDFDRARDSFKLGNKYARTPGRNIWRTAKLNITDIKSSKNAADELHRSGYILVGWDLEWNHNSKMHLDGDHKRMLKRIDSIFFNDLEKTPKHLVLLSHDQYLTDENSVKELDHFITGLQKSNRFEFRKISEYPHINDILN